MLRRELGEAPSGLPRFQWFRTTELPLFARMEGNGEVPTGGRITLVVPRWEKRDWSQLLGQAWVLAMWHPPMPRRQWDDMNIQSPYPSQGSYMPVAGAVIPRDSADPEPDELRTRFVIARLKKDLERSLKDRQAEAEDTLKRVEQKQKNYTDEWLRDTFTAFGNVPGHKGHTAFQVPGLRDPAPQQGE